MRPTAAPITVRNSLGSTDPPCQKRPNRENFHTDWEPYGESRSAIPWALARTGVALNQIRLSAACSTCKGRPRDE